MKHLKKFLRNHDEFCFVACSVLIIAAIAGSIYGYVHHVQTIARNQAVARAKQMDGRTNMNTTIANLNASPVVHHNKTRTVNGVVRATYKAPFPYFLLEDPTGILVC